MVANIIILSNKSIVYSVWLQMVWPITKGVTLCKDVVITN